MGLLDGPLRNVSANLIGMMGKTITLIEVQTGVFQPENDTAPLTEINHTVKAILGEVTAGQARGNVERGDRSFQVAAADLGDGIPDTSWRLILDGDQYNIIEVVAQYANEQAVLYTLYARSANSGE